MIETDRKNIAIIKLSALGDIIHTLPAFTLLREAFPHSKISWFVEPVGAKLLKNFTGIDQIIIIDLKKKSFLNQLKEIIRIRSLYGKKTFDLVLDFQGLVKSAALAWLLKGKMSVGFHKKNLKEPIARLFYRQTVDFFDETDQPNYRNHVAFKNLHLANFDGSISAKIHWDSINIPLADLDRWDKGVKEFLSRHHLEPGRFLILNIGGGWESKLLYPSQYIDIVNGIKEKYKTVILWGNEKEKKVAEQVSQKTDTVMADFFNFSELILLIKYSRLVVSGDTLPLHLADLVKTPSVGIFGPTSPFRNGSLMQDSISIYEKLPCGFCYKKKCGTIECIKKINIDKVIQSIGLLYEKYD
jgi:heptosyltransferase-1